MLSCKRLSNRTRHRAGPHTQRGRLIELQILFAAAMIFLVVVGVGLANDKGFLAALTHGVITVAVVIGSIVGLCALVACWEWLRDWMATPAIVRAVTKADPLQALEKLSRRQMKANAVNSAGLTALHVACNDYRPVELEQTVKVIGFLLAHGADVNAQTPMDETPLCLAAKRGYPVDVIRCLLAHGARADTALKAAVWRSGEDAAEIVALLLDAGASVAARDALGDTPLHWAAGMGTAKTVSALIQRGADVRACNRQMQTPLHEVLDRLDLKAPAASAIVQLLIAVGADVHAADSQGRTPSTMAHDAGKAGLVAALSAGTEAEASVVSLK